ncbi:uroporphyrinogen-III synthase, partial [Burkholderia sp. Cy-647]
MTRTRAFTAVLTKPEGQSAALAAQLAAAGIEAFDFPLIDIAPVADPAPLDAAFARLDAYALVVFVSPNAIDRALARFNAIWPHSLPVGVVGPGSVAALARHGIAAPAHRVIAPGTQPEDKGGDEPRYDSESLYAQIERAFVPVVPRASSGAGAGVATDDHGRHGGDECSSEGAKPVVPGDPAGAAAQPLANPGPDSFPSSDSPAASAAVGPLAGKRVL